MFLKDPGSTLDYRVDWTAACADGQTVLTSEWLVEPAQSGGLMVGGQSLSGLLATVRLSGGGRGILYRIVNRVTFSNGLVDERTIALRVEDR